MPSRCSWRALCCGDHGAADEDLCTPHGAAAQVGQDQVVRLADELLVQMTIGFLEVEQPQVDQRQAMGGSNPTSRNRRFPPRYAGRGPSLPAARPRRSPAATAARRPRGSCRRRMRRSSLGRAARPPALSSAVTARPTSSSAFGSQTGGQAPQPVQRCAIDDGLARRVGRQGVLRDRHPGTHRRRCTFPAGTRATARRDALRIAAPQAAQRAALQEHRRADARPVVDRKPLDVEDAVRWLMAERWTDSWSGDGESVYGKRGVLGCSPYRSYRCSVRAMISSCMSGVRLTKNSLKPATRTTRSRYCSGSFWAARSVSRVDHVDLQFLAAVLEIDVEHGAQLLALRRRRRSCRRGSGC